MYNFGNVNSHSNSIHFGNFAGVDNPTSYILALDLILNATAVFTSGHRLLKKFVGNSGWTFGVALSGSDTFLQAQHGDGISFVSSLSSVVSLQTGTFYRVVVYWTGTIIYFILNGSLLNNNSFSQAIAANAGNFVIGNDAGGGSAAKIGNVHYWKNPGSALSYKYVAGWSGGILPASDKLTGIFPARFDPDIELITGTAGIKGGTVTIVKDQMGGGWGNKQPKTFETATQSRIISAFPKDLRDELNLGDRGRLFVGVELDLASSTLKLARRVAGTASKSRGQYQAKITSITPISQKINLDSLSLDLGTQLTAVIEDEDLSLTHELEGPSIRWKNRNARVYYLSDKFSPFLRFSGIIDSIKRVSNVPAYAVAIRVDSRLLDSPPKLPRITRGGFSLMPNDLEGTAVPLIYGRVNHAFAGPAGSTASGDQSVGGGLTSVGCIDWFGLKWLAAFGRCRSVYRVQSGGIYFTAYTMLNPSVGGRYYTVIDFSSAPAVTASVSFDIEGLTDLPLATTFGGVGVSLKGMQVSGRLITDPVEQLEHFLANFVYNEWKSESAWFSPEGLISNYDFDLCRRFIQRMDFSANHEPDNYWGVAQQAKIPTGRLHARAVITADNTVLSYLEKFCKQFNVIPFWGIGGKLAIRPVDFFFSDADVYDSEADLNLDAQASGEVNYDVPLNYLFDSFKTQAGHHPGNNDYHYNSNVKDTSLGYSQESTYTLDWAY